MSLNFPEEPACKRRNVTRTRRTRRHLVVSAVSGLVLVMSCLGGAIVAHADDLKDQQSSVENDLAQTSEDLADASAAVRAAQATVIKVAKDLPGAETALAKARRELNEARAEDNAIAGRLASSTKQLNAVQHEVNAAAGVLAERSRLVGVIARAQYNGLALGEISNYFAASDPADLVERAALVRSVLYSTNSIIKETAAAKRELEKKKQTLAVVNQQIAGLREQSRVVVARVLTVFATASAAETKVSGLVSQRKAALAIAAEYLKEVERKYQRLQAKSREIQQQLAARGATSGPGVPGKGGLLWPTNGTKTSDFGYRSDPFTGRQKFHAGIDISGSIGQPIYAARTGVVAFTEGTASSGGYGNYTCLDHGGGFATCYAHQSEFLVSAGQAVSQGTIIGRVGSTGNSTGAHLHYETRVNGNPVDPMQYY